jgi:hypothetical protein
MPSIVVNAKSLGVLIGYQHVATDWELASDSNFTNLIVTNYADTTNLLQYTFTTSSPGPYYVRARARYLDLEGNYHIGPWSNVNKCMQTVITGIFTGTVTVLPPTVDLGSNISPPSGTVVGGVNG